MVIIKETNAISNYIHWLKKQGKTIAFVPTMGTLHKGHLSLIEAAKNKANIIVCSIFVNPTQFNNPDDFAKYPVNIQNDIMLLENSGVPLLFLPDVNNIYPDGTAQLPHYNFGYLDTVLEGAYRPGHFQGVGQVMHRLMQIIQPHFLFLGQKDYQQCMIIEKLLSLINIKTEVIISPTQREANGLAMSSRNLRLNAEDRERAGAIYQTLLFIKKNILQLSFAELKRQALQKLEAAGFTVDYIEIADAKNLQLLSQPIAGNMIVLAAATIHGVRLIDNLLL